MAKREFILRYLEVGDGVERQAFERVTDDAETLSEWIRILSHFTRGQDTIIVQVRDAEVRS